MKLDVTMDKRDIVRRIREDTTSGASEIMKKTVECLSFISSRLGEKNPEQYFDTMTEFGCELISAQPTMAPVFNIINTVLMEIEPGIEEGHSTKEMQQRVNNAVERIVNSAEEALARMRALEGIEGLYSSLHTTKLFQK